LLDSGESLLLRISASGDAGDPGSSESEGTLTVVNPCLSGGTLEIFLEPVIPAPTIAVHGESPIATALAVLAERVGFEVVESGGGSVGGGAGAAPAAVVVASHGRNEEPVLEAAVRASAQYVGLVASRKRGEAVVAALDLDDAQRASVHTPAGLDIGARTPREVALSILAEIVARRPRPSGMAGTSIPTATTATTGSAEPAAQPEVATDLVCGMSVVADDTALHLDHGGVRYWFCGTGCLRAFAADPSAYLPGPSD
jgi:xanthine dehydrogenase accessory factor